MERKKARLNCNFSPPYNERERMGCRLYNMREVFSPLESFFTDLCGCLANNAGVAIERCHGGDIYNILDRGIVVGKIDGASKPYLYGTYHLVCIAYSFEELVTGVRC